MDHDDFLEFARRLGVHIASDHLIADGRIHRADVDADRSGKNDAAYLLREDGSGWVTNFKASGKPEYFRRGEQKDLTPEELAALAAQREARQAEQIERNRLAVVDSVEQWEASREPKDFPYLCEPRLDPAGLRQCRGRLLVPVLRFDQGGELGWAGMQRIEPAPAGTSPEKRFVPGTATSGSFAVIPIQGSGVESPLDSFDAVRNAPRVVFCEGVGTALAIHQATGLPVIAALSAQNLPEVARALHDKLRGQVVVYADNDGERAGYKGQVYAVRTARVMGSARTRIALPERAGGMTPPGYDARDQLRDGPPGAIAATIEKALRAEQLERRIPERFRESTSKSTPSVKSENEFVRSPTGAAEFGEIGQTVAKVIGRQAGLIRLRRRDLEHIEQRHGSEIRMVGFRDAAEFVASTLDRGNAIYQGTRGALIVSDQNSRPNRAAVLVLQPAVDAGGDYYAVTTALPVRPMYLHNKKLLLSRDGPITRRSRGNEPFSPGRGAAPTIEQAESANKRSLHEEGAQQFHSRPASHREAAMGAAGPTPDQEKRRMEPSQETPSQELARTTAAFNRESDPQKRQELRERIEALRAQIKQAQPQDRTPPAGAREASPPQTPDNGQAAPAPAEPPRAEGAQPDPFAEMNRAAEDVQKTPPVAAQAVAGETPEEKLLRQYREATAPQREARAKALRELDGQHREEQGALFDALGQLRLEKERELAPMAEEHRKSLIALEVAKRVEALHKTQAGKRKDLAARLLPVPSLRNFLEARAGSDPVAARMLEEEVRRGPQAESIRGRRTGEHEPVTLEGLTWEVDTSDPKAKAVHYARDGERVMSDRGERLDLYKVEDREIEAALRLAEQKYDMEAGLVLTGSREFQSRAAEIAGRIGVKVRNEELQAAWQAGRQQAMQEEGQGEERHLPAGGIEPGRSSAPDLDKASQQHLLAEGVLARLQPAAWSALEKAGQRQALSPQERELLQRDSHADLVDGEDRLTPLGEVVHARMQARIEAEREQFQQQLRGRNVDEEMERRKREEAAHGKAEVSSERRQERIDEQETSVESELARIYAAHGLSVVKNGDLAAAGAELDSASADAWVVAQDTSRPESTELARRLPESFESEQDFVAAIRAEEERQIESPQRAPMRARSRDPEVDR
ncbi:putative DNA primase [Burkholderiales bacterium GJ-E10]|nr:putative DNA primase [Burkholderiales bacterium GJ-E10]